MDGGAVFGKYGAAGGPGGYLNSLYHLDPGFRASVGSWGTTGPLPEQVREMFPRGHGLHRGYGFFDPVIEEKET